MLPDKYLGNLASLDRPWFEFDYRKIEGGTSQWPMQMRLIGRKTVYVWSGARPRTSWEHFRVPLDKSYFVKFEGEATFDEVLRNVERIELSMDVAAGPEINGLDNFYLRTEFTAPGGRALQLNRERILLIGVSGGPVFPAEPFEITSTGGTVQWTAFVTPVTATWLRVSPGSGETPDNAEIFVDPSGLPPGTHTAGVVIRAAESSVASRTIEVSVVLDPQTSAPRINAGGVVHAVDPSLRLSAGGLVSLYGERLAPGEQQAGFVDGKLPRELLGAEVRVQDPNGDVIYRAPLLYVSPGQINFQMPFEVAGLPSVRVTVSVNGSESPPEGVVLAACGSRVVCAHGGPRGGAQSGFLAEHAGAAGGARQHRDGVSDRRGAAAAGDGVRCGSSARSSEPGDAAGGGDPGRGRGARGGGGDGPGLCRPGAGEHRDSGPAGGPARAAGEGGRADVQRSGGFGGVGAPRQPLESFFPKRNDVVAGHSQRQYRLERNSHVRQKPHWRLGVRGCTSSLASQAA